MHDMAGASSLAERLDTVLEPANHTARLPFCQPSRLLSSQVLLLERVYLNSWRTVLGEQEHVKQGPQQWWERRSPPPSHACARQLSFPSSSFFLMACCPWYTVASMMPLTAWRCSGERSPAHSRAHFPMACASLVA